MANKLLAHIAMASGNTTEWNMAMKDIWDKYISTTWGLESTGKSEQQTKEERMREEYQHIRSMRPKLTIAKDSKGRPVLDNEGKPTFSIKASDLGLIPSK